jgi:cytochrome c
MKQIIFICLSIFLFQGCSNSQKIKDPKTILQNTCQRCHNLQMPPKISSKELAPGMMAVVFHLKDFIKSDNALEHKRKFVEFVVDYILHPTIKKAYCDKKSIKKYGLMPSLEGEINQQEAKEVAKYIYDTYDPKKFYALEQERLRFESLPLGNQLAIKHGCLSCHDIKKTKIAPSFVYISKNSSKEEIKNTILNGSRGKYKNFKATMPPLGKKMSSKDLDEIIKWIISLKDTN